jgi:SAM-dependent methyltransferase
MNRTEASAGIPDDPAQQLTDRYDRESGAYRDLWAPILRTASLRLLGGLVSASVERVLDVGTGVGTLLPDLRTTFPSALVVGVDRSRGMVALAPEGTHRAVMDARALAMPSGSVDRVVMAFMLFHLENPMDGLSEARRVLRGEGRLGTVTWGGDLESRATRIWTECLDAHGAPPPDPAIVTRHDRVDSSQKMETLLRAAGFGAARGWEDELVHSIEAEHLLRLKTSLGSSKPRFDSLDPPARAACMAEGRRRMTQLAPEDFIARGRIVYAVGCV